MSARLDVHFKKVIKVCILVYLNRPFDRNSRQSCNSQKVFIHLWWEIKHKFLKKTIILKLVKVSRTKLDNAEATKRQRNLGTSPKDTFSWERGRGSVAQCSVHPKVFDLNPKLGGSVQISSEQIVCRLGYLNSKLAASSAM